MSDSSESPRIYRVAYEPNFLPAAASVVSCPRCDGTGTILRPDLTTTGAVTAVSAAPASGLPETESLRVPVARVLARVLEVIDGRRPAEQLVPVVAPSVLRYARAARPARRPGQVARLLSLRVCRPHPGAAEVAAVAALHGRVRAVAARFEHDPSGWRCTVLRIL